MEVIVWTTHRPHIQHKRSLIIYAMPSKDEYQCQSFPNEGELLPPIEDGSFLTKAG